MTLIQRRIAAGIGLARLKASTDTYFNDIPLCEWDRLTGCFTTGSLSERVVLLKDEARKMVDAAKTAPVVWVDAVDQYGVREKLGATKHPRRDLLKRLYATHAEKLYQDTENGTKHIGYIVQGRWFTLYNVTQWEGEA